MLCRITLIVTAFCLLSLTPVAASVGRNDNSEISQSTGVPLYEWKDDRLRKPGKILIVVHGFAQQANALNTIAETFAEKGYLVISPDLRGHGRWQETDATMEQNLKNSCDDLAKLLTQLQKRYKRADIFCLGESTGSGVVMSAVAKRPRKVRAVILCATGSQPAFHNPAVMGMRFIKGMASMVSQVDIKSYLEHYLSDDPRIAQEMIADPLAKKSQSALQLLGTMSFIRDMPVRASLLPDWIPVLVLQGTEDKIVNPQSAQNVFDALKTRDKEFVEVPGSGHILVGTSFIKPDVMKKIDAWLENHSNSK